MTTLLRFVPLGFFLASLAVAAPPNAIPSRAAEKGCVWERLSDATVGLEAWVQRCDFGFRKISFLFVGNSLAIRYSDGGAPEPLVDVHSLKQGETPEAGVQRFFAAHTDKKLVARCVSEPFQEPKAACRSAASHVRPGRRLPEGARCQGRSRRGARASVWRVGDRPRRHPVLRDAACQRGAEVPLREGGPGPAAL